MCFLRVFHIFLEWLIMHFQNSVNIYCQKYLCCTCRVTDSKYIALIIWRCLLWMDLPYQRWIHWPVITAYFCFFLVAAMSSSRHPCKELLVHTEDLHVHFIRMNSKINWPKYQTWLQHCGAFVTWSNYGPVWLSRTINIWFKKRKA